MKLLIVDDQQATLRGLTQGIDWAAEGFETVDTAVNAMEARVSFQKTVPQVMLCDIEMPVENGIELCRWVRAQGYSTQVIFLTCHSDFEYTKEAISLQATDYILQPASYDEIKKIVRKAVIRLEQDTRMENLQSIGENYVHKQDVIRSSLWRSYLLGIVTESGFKSIPNMPSLNGEGYLVLMQLVQWDEGEQKWKEAHLAAALRSYVQDLFEENGECAVSSCIDKNTYSIVVQPSDVNGFKKEQLTSKLEYLSSVYDLYMPGKAAFFVTRI